MIPPFTTLHHPHSDDFMDKAKEAGKPFFIWHNTARMHVWTDIPPEY